MKQTEEDRIRQEKVKNRPVQLDDMTPSHSRAMNLTKFDKAAEEKKKQEKAKIAGKYATLMKELKYMWTSKEKARKQ